MLEGEGDLVREVQGGLRADQHDVLVLRGKDSSKIISSRKYHLSTAQCCSKVLKLKLLRQTLFPSVTPWRWKSRLRCFKRVPFLESLSLNVDV